VQHAEIGWEGLCSKGVGESLGEIKSMMGDSFRRKVRSEWLEVASKQPKLALLREVMRKHEEPTVVYIDDKRQRRMMMMIQGGTVRLRIEMGRWRNEQREQRICRHCVRGEVGDVAHWFLYCSNTTWWRDNLKSRWCRSMGWEEMSDEEKVVNLLHRGSIDSGLRQMIEKLWEERFR
jgi:hypothetical protein